MGAWGIGSFENDDALDWVIELEASDDLSVIQEALKDVFTMAEDYLEVGGCCRGIAAAEVIAALHGQAKLADSDAAAAWVEAHRDLDTSAIVPEAQRALQIILSKSELQELWADSDDYDTWVAEMNDLQSRLG